MSLKKEKYVLVKFKLAVYIFQNKTNKQTSRNETENNTFCREVSIKNFLMVKTFKKIT